MKKLVVRLILICLVGCLLLGTVACANNGNKQIESLTQSAETNISPEDEYIIIDEGEPGDYSGNRKKVNPEDVLTIDYSTHGKTIDVNTDINSYRFYFGRERFYFPLYCGSIAYTKWRYTNPEGLKGSYDSRGYVFLSNFVARYENGPKLSLINLYSPNAEDGDFEDSFVTNFILFNEEGFDEMNWVIPGGITPQSTAADVLEIFGNPSTTKEFDEYSYMDDKYLIYSNNKDTGISYTFTFYEDGTIEKIGVSISESAINTPYVFSGKYFSVVMPSVFRGRIVIKSESDLECTLAYEDDVICHSYTLIPPEKVFDVDDEGYLIGYVKNKQKNYELVVYTEIKQSTSTMTFCEHEMCESYFDDAFDDCFIPVKGYVFEEYDGNKYKGDYYGYDGEKLYEVIIYKKDYPFLIRCTKDYKSTTVENIEFVISHNHLSFHSRRLADIHQIDGYIQFNENGTTYLNITSEEPEENAVEMKTTKDIKLLRYGATKEIPIDQNVKSFIGKTAKEIIDEFGEGYYRNSGYIYYQGQDITFAPEMFMSTGLNEKIVGVFIYGEHDLGEGIFSNMSYNDVRSIFDDVDKKPVFNEMDQDYILTVQKGDYYYSFSWDDEYTWSAASSVYITKVE